MCAQTNNFDYQRWAENFQIPPMQTLEDVLVMALKGADPYQIELLLKKRGDYRPHQEFGINLSIPWSAGTKEDPNYHVHTGSVYTTTKARANRPDDAPHSPPPTFVMDASHSQVTLTVAHPHSE